MKKRIISGVLALSILFGAYFLFNEERAAEKTLFAFDTVVEISLRGRDREKALEKCEEEIKRLHAELDAEGSGAIARYNENGTTDEETRALLSRAYSVSEETEGAFDVTLYPVIRLWGFGGDTFKVPSDAERTEALEECGYDKLKLGGAKVDFGAAAKGYAADRLCEILENYGISDALISVGGTIAVRGRTARVAIQNPNGEGYAAVLECRDTVLSTSGGYERYFIEDGVKYSHIFNPKTGCPAESDLVSATAISTDGFLSDALSTAFFVMGEDETKKYLKAHKDVDAVLITKDGRLIATPGVRITECDKNYKSERMENE